MIAVLILLVIIVGLIYYTWPLIGELKQAKADLALAEINLTTGQEYITKIQSASRKLAEIKPQIELLDIAMPKEPDIPEALVQINDIVNANGLTITGLTPSVTEGGDIHFILDVTGEYGQVRQSIVDIESNLRPLKVINVGFNMMTDTETDTETLEGSYEIVLSYLKDEAVTADSVVVDETSAATGGQNE